MSETATKDPENKIEIDEPAQAPEAAPAPTHADLKKEGWSADEIAAAEKRGILPKTSDAKAAPKAEPEKAPAKAEAAAEPETKEPEKPKGGIPEVQLTADEERKLLEIFPEGHAVRGVYLRMKTERRTRQKLEADVAALKAQLAAKAQPAADPEADAEGEDLDKPMTARMLLDLKKKEAEEAQRLQEQQAERQQIVTAARAEQEDYAKSVYSDWTDTVKLAADLAKNLETMFPEKHRRARVGQLLHDFQVAAVRADELGLDDNHSAFIAYEIGKMHPNYGKAAPAAEEPTKDGPSKEPKAPGAIKPETLKRIEQQTQRRGSSAAVPAGGGKRTIDADEVTPEVFLGWDFKRRAAFKEKFPEQYARLTRG